MASDEVEPDGDEEPRASVSRDGLGYGTFRSAETEVAYEDLVRGYEVEPETYVFLETDEIERARPAPSRVIDLEQFVRLEDIDPIYFEKAYYVSPGRDAEKSYDLLLRTLSETGRVGIGRFVLRTKPHLVALRPMEGALALETLYFGDEVRMPARSWGAGPPTVTDREIDSRGTRRGARHRLGSGAVLGRVPGGAAPDDRRAHAGAGRGGATTTWPRESRVGELLDALERSVEEAKARGKPKGGRRRLALRVEVAPTANPTSDPPVDPRTEPRTREGGLGMRSVRIEVFAIAALFPLVLGACSDDGETGMEGRPRPRSRLGGAGRRDRRGGGVRSRADRRGCRRAHALRVPRR